jgi:uncharacterized protein (TIGR02145 family)
MRMKSAIITGLVLILLACSREEQVPLSLALDFSVSQPKTVESTICTARLSGPATLDTSDFLYRWDWESDEIWDTRYSAASSVRKDFTEPGDYLVTVEALSEDGKVLTATKTLKVIQGFSAPRPIFIVSPDSGNIKTVFTFDAGSTSDAEEEMNMLTFSWDFDNDQVFDFTVKGNPRAEHQFAEAARYTVTLMVSDTSGLSGKISREVSVNRVDTLIRPVLTLDPEYPSDLDTLRISAAESFYSGNPDIGFRYSWKRLGTVWDEPAVLPVYTWIRPPTGTYLIRVRVFSPEGLYNEGQIEVVVSRANKKPTARITRNMRFGNIFSVFEFSAWSSSDPENVPSQMQARWDFEGDGNWDTPFDYEKNIKRVYDVPGVYQVTMQIMDSEGLKDEASIDIHVSRFSNPTGQLKDIRDDRVYGIVRIGDRWWMGENLQWLPVRYSNTSRVPWICYADHQANCDALGRLYHAEAMVNYFDGTTEERNLCPRGWHLPTKDEFQDLIQAVGSGTAGTAMAYGGSSDFNLLPAGYAAYYVYGGFTEFQTDSIYRVAYLLSSDVGTMATTLQHRRYDEQAQLRNMPADGYYSVRCVKDR